MEDNVGQLSVDIFQTKDELILLAPIAGTSLKDINITVTDDVLTIKGARNCPHDIDEKDYLTKECFWGEFRRAVVLPKNVDSKQIKATSFNNILEIRIPKTSEDKTKVVKINVDQ
ncbi:Hsp20/alpha crystallin family protein [Candidatus Peregrinibacteria bacterium]|jgi:HSP20 family protein|nr:Hsp20/alpha crystallin family protein [Candidatus Peregrinibacteria bacterium]MBT4148426.1 Hsp20/alpha crystallin family protein [Candidatus Peregrinibacteria bacterium]MBT4366485.1 Hsp20/alpha crystallin family protein [Candidatus Peregrinibacteria bacterium]MBT4456064.1 Hsp20/alpha crystallin family protein [Candidatus Peregrinibacteria bacterium]